MSSIPIARRGDAQTPAGRGSRPAGARRRDWRMALEIVAFTAPALLLFALFVVWPILRAVQFSLFRWNGFGPLVDFVGLQNYASVLANEVFTDAVVHNLIIVVASILIQLPLGLAIALLLNRRMRGQGLLRTIIFVPYVLSEVIAGVVWFQLLQPGSGALEAMLGLVGLEGPYQGFLGTPMTLQFTWQGCDSLLAAPLVLDLVRFTDLARRRGQVGQMTFLASFFKSPQGVTEQGFVRQFQMLEQWAAQA